MQFHCQWFLFFMHIPSTNEIDYYFVCENIYFVCVLQKTNQLVDLFTKALSVFPSFSSLNETKKRSKFILLANNIMAKRHKARNELPSEISLLLCSIIVLLAKEFLLQQKLCPRQQDFLCLYISRANDHKNYV